MAGRPTKYSEKLASAICLRLAEGESLRSICKDEKLPCEATVRHWAVEDREGFFARYARSRDIGLDAIADETLEIADDGTNDWMERHDQEGGALGWHINGEHVQRSRLRVDTRKWYLSKLASGKYGEKKALEHSGPGGGPIQTRTATEYTDDELAAFIAAGRN